MLIEVGRAIGRFRRPWGVIAALSWLGAIGCRGGDAESPSAESQDIELPGVDTRDLTPRERHEFTRFVRELESPCPSVAVPIAQCLQEKRDCRSCLPAAVSIAQAVRQGMATAQVEGMYKQRFDPTGAKAIPLEGSPSRGPESAPVTLVEFADFACPFCQRIAPQLDELWQKRQTSVHFVFKFMPLAVHPHAEEAARAAIAAQAQGTFWEMDRQLFANGDHLEAADLDAYARLIGLDVDRYDADRHSPETTARLEADRKLADAIGVKGTPTIFINGHEYDTKQSIADWVDTEIAVSK
jgi:protein-disulfide isomerase